MTNNRSVFPYPDRSNEMRNERRRNEPSDRERVVPRPSASAIICAALGGLILLVGLMSLPHALARFDEDPAEGTGRLAFIGLVCAVGCARLAPVVRALFRGRSRSNKDRDDTSAGW